MQPGCGPTSCRISCSKRRLPGTSVTGKWLTATRQADVIAWLLMVWCGREEHGRAAQRLAEAQVHSGMWRAYSGLTLLSDAFITRNIGGLWCEQAASTVLEQQLEQRGKEAEGLSRQLQVIA